MIIGIQIGGTLFALVMLYLTWKYIRSDTLSGGEGFFWLAVWVCAGLFALMPHLLAPLAARLDFARAWDLVVAIASVIVILLSFISFVRVKKTEQRVTELVQRLAKEKR